MKKRITDIIIESFSKLFSLALQQKDGSISFNHMEELTKDLVQETAADMHRRTISSFVTDN